MFSHSVSRATLVLGLLAASIDGAGYRTVGSSGVAAQMVFLPPYTTKAIIIDKGHPNHGYPTVNLQTGQHQAKTWIRPGTRFYVYGAEYDWRTNGLRALNPLDDTSCSIGAFLPDGTLVNPSGAQPNETNDINQGFDQVRSYAPGPCPSGRCTTNWRSRPDLRTRRWYPSAQTLTGGGILVVGGAKVGGLVTNDFDINVPSYEVLSASTLQSTKLVKLPLLNIPQSQNRNPNYAYNMYPLLHLLPNDGNANQIFTLAGNRAIIWDYANDVLVKTLPNIPVAARTFPSSASTALLPLIAPGNTATVLVCGGSSNDIPNPVGLADCYTITPSAAGATWRRVDNMPNGGQTMSNAVLLPDGNVLLLNGARKGCAGGFMADNPVLTPILFNPSAPAGSQWTSLPGTNIPRMYHSVAILLPSGEVMVAGSNTPVGYSATGRPQNPKNIYPRFMNAGNISYLHKQQPLSVGYPTEYRVEMFSPPYIGKPRPAIIGHSATVAHNANFNVSATFNGQPVPDSAQVVLIHPGFSTHAQNQGQRMAVMQWSRGSETKLIVKAPKNGSVMPSGIYLIWVVVDGVPSQGQWISLQF